ncbi:MAG: hypothetical protein LLG14_06480 [Nocardiaceae bacterium]|nr:hypothetical protein [Nocardiaceae bacterium]
MDIAEKAAEIRSREAAEDAQRQLEWDITRCALDDIAAEVVAECTARKLKKTRLKGLLRHKAWTFSIRTPRQPGQANTCMHLAFYPDNTWTLLGCDGDNYVTPVDKWAPFHPGLRQGFVYDKHRHEADVVFRYSPDQLRELIFSEMNKGRQDC